MGFTCTVCGEYHDDLPLDIRFELPEAIYQLDAGDREQRAQVWDDAAILDAEGPRARHFVRGLIEVPILGLEAYFGYGVWIEVAEEDWLGLGDLWEAPDGSTNPPFEGTLANEIASYPGSDGLPVLLRLRDPGTLPSVTVMAAEHPLGHAQERGISRGRSEELAATALH